VGLPAIDVVEHAADPTEPVAAGEAGAKLGLQAARVELLAFGCLSRQLALNDGRLAILHRDHEVGPGVIGFLTKSFHDLVIPLGAQAVLE
jgi:hypothetical protein